MNILLITNMYPAFPNQSNIKATYAVHNFAREWAKSNNVKVVRIWTTYPRAFNLIKKCRTANRFGSAENYMIDDVHISRITISKTPKIDYKDKDIQKTAMKIIKLIYDEYKNDDFPDIVICDILNPFIYIGEIVAAKFNSKLIASLHNSDIFYLKIPRNYRRFMKIEENIDKIVFRSNRIENCFFQLYKGGKNNERFKKVLFGIQKSEIINHLLINQKILMPNKIVLVAANLRKLKKIDVLINAFSQIKNKNGFVLKILGDGPERKNLEELVKSLNIENEVFFEGEKNRNEVLKYMEESDIFALVSSPETFGLVYIEAMSKACITIGSKGEGIDGVIINEVNGFLCSPDSVAELSQQIEKAISLKKELKYQMINNAISTVEDLTNESLATKFLNEINS